MTVSNPYLLLALVAGTLVVTALAYIATAAGSLPPPQLLVRRSGRLAASHRLMAVSLGMRDRDWLIIRLAAPVLVLGFCTLILHFPLTFDVLAFVVALFALPWLFKMTALRRQLRMETEFVGQMQEFESRIASGQAMNDILQDFGHHPAPGLERVMTPLSDQSRPLVTNIQAVGEASRSTLITTCCALLMLSLRRNQEVLAELLRDNIVPYLQDLLRARRARQATLSYQRGIIMAMGLVQIGFFTLTYVVAPAYREVYERPILGTGIIVVVALMFLGLAALVSSILRPAEETEWDLAAVALIVDEIERQ